MAEAQLSHNDPQAFRVLVKSVGTARPATAAAIAKGLGLPAATVVSRLYRAPSVLVDGIDETLANRMSSLLDDIGYETEVQQESEPAPTPSELHDVAVYLHDPRKLETATCRVAAFLGISESDASQMLLTPPGVVLGSVSEATIDAFRREMADQVSILSSRPDKALYALFLNSEPGVVQNQILADIRKAGVERLARDGLVASEVDHDTAVALWKRHQASNQFRIVNQDFLRFDLILQKPSRDQLPGDAWIEVLEKHAGVPADMADEVLAAAPIRLIESVPNAGIGDYLETFAEAGLQLRADLITFQMLGIRILSCKNRLLLQEVLERFGLWPAGKTLPRTPFDLDGVMPELRARVIGAALEDTSAVVEFTESGL